MLFDLSPEVIEANSSWRENLAYNANYQQFCAITLTKCAIIQNQLEAEKNESADPEIKAFNQAIIRNADRFAALYARITSSTIEDVATHYASREAFMAYTLANWELFFAQGKEIVLA